MSRKKPPAIHEDELIKALQEAATITGDDKGHTTEELMQKLGMSKTIVRNRLHEVRRAGKLGVGRKMQRRIDDVFVPKSCYWIK